MRAEIRRRRDHADLLLVAESPEENAMIDQVFGNRVGPDGLIWRGAAECRLSDGYADHYVLIKGQQVDPGAIHYAKIVVREADAGRADIPRTEQLARALLVAVGER